MVSRLKEAGMVMVGKANMDEFAMGSSNETSYYGPVKNPWMRRGCPVAPRAVRPRRWPRGLAPLATATDTGGSIRQPACAVRRDGPEAHAMGACPATA